MNCAKAGCAGEIDPDGFCDVCGHQAATPSPAEDSSVPGDVAAAPSHLAVVTPTSGAAPPTAAVNGAATATLRPATSGSGLAGGTGRSGTRPQQSTVSRTVSGRGSLGAGLVEIPPVPAGDPTAAVLNNPEVPESKRYCTNRDCGRPVGRARQGRPARAVGYCPACGVPYSFVPGLDKGDVVQGQYEVLGCVAHGGLGWIYIARDLALDGKWVILKGLLDTGDASAMEAAINERRFLAEVQHPNIVHIYNFVQHRGESYIVMEYLSGKSLRELRKPGPLPAATAAALMLEALPALAYLHGRGLLFCDFKPDNLIQSEELLQLIDLGAVRRADDDTSDIYGTPGYQAPEIAESGPSVASDLYSVARSLAVLTFDFAGFQDSRRHLYSLPDASDVPVLQKYPAMHRFILKGTDPDPSKRFESAAETAEQLRGVLRQIVAIDGGEPPSSPSTLFGPDVGSDPGRADWRDLPVPLPEASDPATPLVWALAGATPEQLLSALSTLEASPEVVYQSAKAQLEAGEVLAARRRIADLIAERGESWRSAWWFGMTLLATGEGVDAGTCFDEVVRALPGELPPLLALGLASEIAGTLRQARVAYEAVVSTDPSYVTAAFGLARVLARQGLRREAVQALSRIPPRSSGFVTGQSVSFSILVSSEYSQTEPEDLVAAAAILDSSHLSPHERAEMQYRLYRSALEVIQDGAVMPAKMSLGAVPIDLQSVRDAHQDACRTLARLTPDSAERTRLVDEANACRARSLL